MTNYVFKLNRNSVQIIIFHTQMNVTEENFKNESRQRQGRTSTNTILERLKQVHQGQTFLVFSIDSVLTGSSSFCGTFSQRLIRKLVEPFYRRYDDIKLKKKIIDPLYIWWGLCKWKRNKNYHQRNDEEMTRPYLFDQSNVLYEAS